MLKNVPSEYMEISFIKGLVLKDKIPANLCADENEYVISWPEANLYGSGNTLYAALEMFKQEVVSMVDDIKSGEVESCHDIFHIIGNYVELNLE